ALPPVSRNDRSWRLARLRPMHAITIRRACRHGTILRRRLSAADYTKTLPRSRVDVVSYDMSSDDPEVAYLRPEIVALWKAIAAVQDAIAAIHRQRVEDLRANEPKTRSDAAKLN